VLVRRAHSAPAFPAPAFLMKLHELLAIESNLETQAAKVRSDLANTFEKKRHLFEEKRTTFTPNSEGAQQVTENQSDLQTTVKKELAWVRPHIAKSWYASYRVSESNTVARADIILEDDAVHRHGGPGDDVAGVAEAARRDHVPGPGGPDARPRQGLPAR